MMSRWMLDIFGIGWVWWLDDILGGGRKEKELSRLHEAIVPYIAKNLQPYITRPPIRSCGDWGQSQFQLWGDDESTHQIPSNGLLFLTFYHFPYTADLPCRCNLFWPSRNHHQLYPIPIAPLVWCHVGDLSYDLQTTLLHFPFLVSSLLPDASFRGPTNHRSSHRTMGTLPYASLHTNLVLILLIVVFKTFVSTPKNKEVFPQNSDLSSSCLIVLLCSVFAPSLYLVLLKPFALLHCPKPPSCTTSHSLTLRQETISLLLNRTPQNHIGYTLRSPSPLIFVAS